MNHDLSEGLLTAAGAAFGARTCKNGPTPPKAILLRTFVVQVGVYRISGFLGCRGFSKLSDYPAELGIEVLHVRFLGWLLVGQSTNCVAWACSIRSCMLEYLIQ